MATPCHSSQLKIGIPTYLIPRLTICSWRSWLIQGKRFVIEHDSLSSPLSKRKIRWYMRRSLNRIICCYSLVLCLAQSLSSNTLGDTSTGKRRRYSAHHFDTVSRRQRGSSESQATARGSHISPLEFLPGSRICCRDLVRLTASNLVPGGKLWELACD
ncbi:hypothetical protein BJ170DRAFT_636709 [Xylariales sp. AK1849]|nr:hypothetical protein BJ170DRAFT_636709 [Xylariales sp. AK1849]